MIVVVWLWSVATAAVCDNGFDDEIIYNDDDSKRKSKVIGNGWKQIFTSIAITSLTSSTDLHISTLEQTVFLKYLVTKLWSWIVVDGREHKPRKGGE